MTLPTVALALALASEAQAPAKRIALLFANNRGLVDDVQLKYADADAVKMAKALIELGGFDPSNVLLMDKAQPDRVRQALGQLARSDVPPAFLFLYYSGHGDEAGLRMGGAPLPFNELTTLVADVHARLAVTLIDACGSGVLTRLKGARLGPAYDIDVTQDTAVEGRIVITSSSDGEPAQESDRLEGSLFTYFWVSGLYGAADGNGDDVVTLDEAFRFAHFRTVERTISSRPGVQRPSYSLALAGQGDVVLANLAEYGSDRGGDDLDSRTVLRARCRKPTLAHGVRRGPERRAAIRVPPGRYRVRKREEAGARVADVTLVAGQVVALRDDQMPLEPYEEPVQKGSVGLSQSVQLGGGGVGWATPGLGAGYVIRAAYRLSGKLFFVQPTVRFSRSTLRDETGSYLHTEVAFAVAPGLRLSFGRVNIALGLELGLAVFDDRRVSISSLQGLLPMGFWGGAIGQISVRVAGPLSVGLDVTGGVLVARDSLRVATPGALGLGLSAQYTWE